MDIIPELFSTRIDLPEGHDFDLIVEGLARDGSGGAKSPDEFAEGDRVRDRTFGQPMVVEDVYPAGFRYRYRCVWTSAAGGPEHELFQAADLTPYRGPSPA